MLLFRERERNRTRTIAMAWGFQVLSAQLLLRLSAFSCPKHTDNEANLPATG